mmetsp:Transcript_12203/g.22618  ORF Transcript_12203/g.22618 Transcript_12203/m.22618 type:complete len:1213 (-) Transcript_12203:989-4627(-)
MANLTEMNPKSAGQSRREEFVQLEEEEELGNVGAQLRTRSDGERLSSSSATQEIARIVPRSDYLEYRTNVAQDLDADINDEDEDENDVDNDNGDEDNEDEDEDDEDDDGDSRGFSFSLRPYRLANRLSRAQSVSSRGSMSEASDYNKRRDLAPIPLEPQWSSLAILGKGSNWSQVQVNSRGLNYVAPGQRSLHVAVVYQSWMFLFGGYDGRGRVNSVHRFDFVHLTWNELSEVKGVPPSPRDRHSAVVVGGYMLIFGGSDGLSRMNDLHAFDLEEHIWHRIPRKTLDQSPSPRHSHCAVAYGDSMFVFGGYDGAYKNDLYAFTIDPPQYEDAEQNLRAPPTGTWTKVAARGRYPSSRYRASCVTFDNQIVLFGGHDGQRHLNCTHSFNFDTLTWTAVRTQGAPPLPRDSHVALVFQGIMVVFGGSSGSAMNDFHYLDLSAYKWKPVTTDGWFPCARFCHVGVEYDNSLYVHGGYDGQTRLKDFHRFKFAPSICNVEEGRIFDDLTRLFADNQMVDVMFQVGTDFVKAHRVLCSRSPLLLNGLEDAPLHPKYNIPVVQIDGVLYENFRQFISYLYTDRIALGSLEQTLEILPLAIQYGAQRLKKICIEMVGSAMTVDNVAVVFQTAHKLKVEQLRKLSLQHILKYFDAVAETTSFEKMGHENFDLVVEILRSRKNQKDLNIESTTEALIEGQHYPAILDDENMSNLREWRKVKVLGNAARPTGPDGDGDQWAERAGSRHSHSKRSLHAMATHRDSLYIFGGYDGERRLTDFLRFDFSTHRWSEVPEENVLDAPGPSPRDRHIAVVAKDYFWVFGGHNGRVCSNELFGYNFKTKRWQTVPPSVETPSERHSHSAAVVKSSIYIFGGFDGSYRNDISRFDTVKKSWTRIIPQGTPPSPRYRSSMVAHENSLYVFGGQDGVTQMHDVHVFDTEKNIWSLLKTTGRPPVARDSHVAVVHSNHMYIFGGSSGNAMNDFYRLKLKGLKAGTWMKLQTSGMVPNPRFCHAATVYGRAMYVYGGYDGSQRLGDFISWSFVDGKLVSMPRSTLLSDLAQFINNKQYSDVTFVVEGQRVYAHKALCIRSPYFNAMFTAGMRESNETEITLADVRYDVFLSILTYLYTDRHDVDIEDAMELFVESDRFGIERLKTMCETKLLSAIDVENASEFLEASEIHSAQSLHERCMSFIVLNFDAVSKTPSFEAMVRSSPDLVIDILRAR